METDDMFRRLVDVLEKILFQFDGDDGLYFAKLMLIDDEILEARAVLAEAKLGPKVIIFPGITRLDVPADRILEGAVGKLESVVIAGFDKDGKEWFASSYADGGDALWILERFKIALLSAGGEDDS